ncbi:Efflux pump vrtL [Colletotrichum fructicola]|nr:Efflux pump vrtL [Colletotrichum fructicola]
MSSTIVIVFLCASYALYSLLCLIRNIRIAKTIGIPVVWSPISPFNPFWIIFNKRLSPIIQRLPLSLGSWTQHDALNWTWVDRAHGDSQVHEKLGDTFAHATPREIEIHTRDPAVADEVLRKRANEFPKISHYAKVLDFLGTSLVSSDGEDWVRHRKATVSTLSDRNNRRVWTETVRQTQQMIQHYFSVSSGRIIDPVEDVREVYLHVFTGVCFGVKYDFRQAAEKYIPEGHSRSYKDCLHTSLKDLLILRLVPKWILDLPVLPHRISNFRDSAREMRQYLDEMIASSKEELEEKGTRRRTQTDNLLSFMVKSNGEIEAENASSEFVSIKCCILIVLGQENPEDPEQLKPEETSHASMKQEGNEAVVEHARSSVEVFSAPPELDRHSTGEDSVAAEDKQEPILITWNGPNDPRSPKNWPSKKKWAAVFCVSFYTLLSPVSSSMVAPALEAIAHDLTIPSAFEQILVLSIFVLAYALGPLIWGPLSELYGRIIILQLTTLLYMAFNLGCGLATTKGQLIAFRFLGGFGGSAPMAVGGAVFADLFNAEERGRAISIYSLAPLLGPAIGPIAGGFITQETTWRWIFYSTTIFAGLVQGIGLFVLQETCAPVLLVRIKNRLVKETGNTALRTEFDNPDRTVIRALAGALTRPFRLFGTQVIIQALAVYMMYLYGIMYLVLSTFSALWTTRYGESTGISGLNYISLGLGFFLGAQTCARFQDRVYIALKKRYVPDGGPGKPEFRVPMMVPGAVLVPVGLLIYGWSAQYKAHWILPNLGAVLFSAGVIVGFQGIQAFLVDTYTRYAASAIGSVMVLRSVAGFGFPLFAPALYHRLDYGWGNTLLALIAVGIGLPGPILLWVFGERLRKRSQFAAG